MERNALRQNEFSISKTSFTNSPRSFLKRVYYNFRYPSIALLGIENDTQHLEGAVHTTADREHLTLGYRKRYLALSGVHNRTWVSKTIPSNPLGTHSSQRRQPSQPRVSKTTPCNPCSVHHLLRIHHFCLTLHRIEKESDCLFGAIGWLNSEALRSAVTFILLFAGRFTLFFWHFVVIIFNIMNYIHYLCAFLWKSQQ